MVQIKIDPIAKTITALDTIDLLELYRDAKEQYYNNTELMKWQFPLLGLSGWFKGDPPVITLADDWKYIWIEDTRKEK